MKETCPNQATFIVPWGGKLLKVCAIHVKGLSMLGNIMGSPVDVQPVLTEENCCMPNDLDEYKPTPPKGEK